MSGPDKLSEQRDDEVTEDIVDLFWLIKDGQGISCAFTLFPPEANKSSRLIATIEGEGGVVDELDPFNIPLIDEGFLEYTGCSRSEIPADYFSSKFISDSVAADRIQDLNKYWAAGSDSRFEGLDANQILKRVQSWADLTKEQVTSNKQVSRSQSKTLLSVGAKSPPAPLVAPTGTVESEAVSDDADLGSIQQSPAPQLLQQKHVPNNSKHQTTSRGWISSTSTSVRRERLAPLSPMDDLTESDFESCASNAASPRAKPKRTFQKYSFGEDKKILEIMAKNCWYTDYKGRAMWKIIEDEFAEAFPHSRVRRTWQGLREHYITVMAEKLSGKTNTYGLPPEQLKLFRNGIAMKGKKFEH